MADNEGGWGTQGWGEVAPATHNGDHGDRGYTIFDLYIFSDGFLIQLIMLIQSNHP